MIYAIINNSNVAVYNLAEFLKLPVFLEFWIHPKFFCVFWFSVSHLQVWQWTLALKFPRVTQRYCFITIKFLVFHMPCQAILSAKCLLGTIVSIGELQKKRNQYFIAKRILNVWMWDWIESCFACCLYPVMIARERTPDREVKAKTEKAPRNGTKRKIENETEVEMEKKRMIKTNENRYCSLVLLHWEKMNAKYYMVCMFDAYYAPYIVAIFSIPLFRAQSLRLAGRTCD